MPLAGQLPGLDPATILSMGSPEDPSALNEPEEPPRWQGGGKISSVPRVTLRVPRSLGGRATSGKLCLERKVGHHEYVLSAPQLRDPVRWIPTQTKYI